MEHFNELIYMFPCSDGTEVPLPSDICTLRCVKPHSSCFPPGVWFLLPLLIPFVSRMPVTNTPSQTRPETQPVFPNTPPQPTTIHSTPVVVGRSAHVIVQIILTCSMYMGESVTDKINRTEQNQLKSVLMYLCQRRRWQAAAHVLGQAGASWC